MSVEAADYGFSERVGADFAEFEFTPPRLGVAGNSQMAFGAFLIALFLGGGGGAIVGAIVTGPWNGGPMVMVIALAGFLWVFWMVFGSMRKSLYKGALGKRIINVSAAGLRVNDKLYERKHIGDIWIDMPTGGQQRVSAGSGVIVGGMGVAGGIAVAGALGMHAADQLGSAVGRAMREGVDKRAHTISIRYGSKPTPIAPMLPYDVAHMLAQKIADALKVYG